MESQFEGTLEGGKPRGLIPQPIHGRKNQNADYKSSQPTPLLSYDCPRRCTAPSATVEPTDRKIAVMEKDRTK